jgi:ribosomal protein L24
MTRETIKEQAELSGINVVVKRYRPKDGNDALLFLKENKEIEVANIVAFDMAKILEENTDYNFSFKKNLWNEGWAGFKIR